VELERLEIERRVIMEEELKKKTEIRNKKIKK